MRMEFKTEIHKMIDSIRRGEPADLNYVTLNILKKIESKADEWKEEIARLTTSHEAEREHLLFRLSEVEADNKKMWKGINHFVAWALTPDSKYTKDEDAWWERERG